MNSICDPETLYWVTGLAGAGKSTIAGHLITQLRENYNNIVLFDGDKFRDALSNDLKHSPSDRLTNAWRIAKMAKYISDQGVIVVAATVSMYDEVRNWLRDNCPKYKEIYVKVDLDTLIKRDQKGLYSGALDGRVQNVAGVNLDIDLPSSPDLIIDNSKEQDFRKIVEAILDL